ncbi:substrate-binding domain-containing protein [Sinorhizobium meliloti]|nr:substrate-binding domain-containing protein [Sinorhizobium meliloti]
MKSFERISAILCGFGPSNPCMRIDSLLSLTGVPTSSGYKIISDLVVEGLLERAGRGMVSLGPSAARLFYAPLRAVMPARTAVIASSDRSTTAPRKPHLEGELLKLVATDRYRKAPPFVIGFANASNAHPWRKALERSLLAAAQRQSHIVSRVIVRDAENDPAQQVAHLKQMRAESVDLCIVSAVNESNESLRDAISELAGHGIPLVGVDRICGDIEDLVSFVTASDETVGRISALWLAEHLKGKGEIVMLCGMKGTSPCTIRLQAALATFADFPEIRIMAIEYTDWLAERGYSAMQNHLGSDWVPDGVWCDSGLQGVGSLNAFRDKGFRRGAIPPHTGGEMNLMYKIAVTEKVPLCGLDYPAAMGAISFQTALDILFGRQVPRIVEADLQIIVTRGHETRSVRADVLAERKVNWTGADTLVHAAGRMRGPRPEREAPANLADCTIECSAAIPTSYTDSVSRLLDIMTLVAKRPVATAYDVARALDLPMSSAYQAINELERLAWLMRSEEGHLLVGKVAQQIALSAIGIDIESHRLQPVVRYLRDQTGETAFAGNLGANLHIGPNLVGFNYNSVRFAPFQAFSVEPRKVPALSNGTYRLQSRPTANEIGGNPRINFLMVPIRPAMTRLPEAELVLGVCWHSRQIDEAQALALLAETQALLTTAAAL